MGVLDDAIREHIELKRQHGASETDLERQEKEALGPARREAAAPAEPAGPEESVADVELEAGPEEDFDVSATEVVPPAVEHEPEWGSDRGAFVDVEAEPLPEEPAHAAHPDPDEDDDVLEETPDFLQETPEHDRLWFEQRPPRDFDFDE